MNLKNTLSEKGVVNQLSSRMNSSFSILLKEHLEMCDTSSLNEKGEYISESLPCLDFAREQFLTLEQEIVEKFDQFRNKWKQRFTYDLFYPVIEEAGWVEKNELGYALLVDGKSKKKQVMDFFYQTLHIMVGDAEKLMVTTLSRSSHIQNRIVQKWYDDTIQSPITKLLPTLEAALRNVESKIFSEIRGQFYPMATSRFQRAFTRKKRRYFTTPEGLFRNVGSQAWNPLGIWDNGFQAFSEDYVDFTQGFCIEVCQWYRNKWEIFLRGFSQGQLDLFSKAMKK